MTTVNSTMPGGANPPFNKTYVQPGRSNSLVLIIVIILFLITIFALGGYVYYKEIYQPSQTHNTSETQSDKPNQPSAAAKVTSEPTTEKVDGIEYEDFVIKLTNDLSGEQEKFSVIVPVNGEAISNNTENTAMIIGWPQLFFQVAVESEDEGYSGTQYLDNFKKITNPNYGDFYRVQTNAIMAEYGESAYTYVGSTNFKNTGTCEGLYGGTFGPVQAPCGDGMLGLPKPGERELSALLRIVCTVQEQGGVEECDKIVASLKKI